MVADVPAFIWLSCPTGQRRPEGTCAGNHVRLEGKQHNTSTGGVPDARADATVRWLHGRNGHPEYRGVHRLGLDHRLLHSYRLDAERKPGQAGWPDDRLPVTHPDRVYRRHVDLRASR